MSAASILITIAIVILLGCYIINGILAEKNKNKYKKYDDDDESFWRN